MKNYQELIDYFRGLCNPLTPSQAAAASFEERVNSIGRFLVGQVLASYRRLSPEGRVAYDPDDLILECWIKLKERDSKYQSARGEYVVFARKIIRNCLVEITEKTRCVKLPANSAGMFRSLQGSQAECDVSRLELLTRTARDHVVLDGVQAEDLDSGEPCPLQIMVNAETAAADREELAKTLSDNLSAVECLALGSYYGAWDNQRRLLRDVARDHNVGVQPLRKALASAREKVRKASGVT